MPKTPEPVPPPPYDAVIPVAPGRIDVARSSVDSLRRHLSIRQVYLLGESRMIDAAKSWRIPNLILLDEDEIVPGMRLDHVKRMQVAAGHDPRRAGYYFQQFLKLGMALREDLLEHYLVWDADTVLLRPMKFFTREGRILITTHPLEMKPVHRDVAKTLLDQEVKGDLSFIREQMMFRKSWVRAMLDRIEVVGGGERSWAQRIMDEIVRRPEQNFGFSEFETYGSFMREHHADEIRFRRIASERDGARRFGLKPNRFDLNFLARDFDYASFESWSRMERQVILRNKWRALLYALSGGRGA
jgi:hypothetical protein